LNHIPRRFHKNEHSEITMLIIPALHISEGRCLRTAIGEEGTEGCYPVDPVQVAKMWRGENAKALHVVGLDFCSAGIKSERALLSEMVQAVDITIQIAGEINSIEDVRIALEDIGLYRVVIGADRVRDRSFMESLVRRYGPRKIVAALELNENDVSLESGGDPGLGDLFLIAEYLRNIGVQRIVFSDKRSTAQSSGPPLNLLHSLVERTNLSVTLNGSVRHYEDMRLLQELHPRKIDSIILDEALYSNAFPCQKIWRRAEQQLIAQQRLL
jgi:phosphoribosylformimino-5-aminoimidazole carboxamide ribotide isomerase